MCVTNLAVNVLNPVFLWKILFYGKIKIKGILSILYCSRWIKTKYDLVYIIATATSLLKSFEICNKMFLFINKDYWTFKTSLFNLLMNLQVIYKINGIKFCLSYIIQGFNMRLVMANYCIFNFLNSSIINEGLSKICKH